MEKFVLLILCSSLSSIRANDCTPNMMPCSDVHDIGTITCAGEGDDCAADPTELDGLLGDSDNKIQEIDAVICKEKCREQAQAAAAGDPKCEFYRWEEEKKGKCILQTICGKPDIPCQSLDEPRCITGQIGCTEEGTPACSLVSPVAYDPDTFHLICHHETGDVNVYSPDDIKEIPTGTECYTIHKCSEWKSLDGSDPNTPPDPLPTYWRKLAVKCSDDGIFMPLNEKTGDDELSGKLVGKTTEDPIGPILVEPVCESACASLALNPESITAKGTELICDPPLEGFNLEDGKSCILICDNHFSMSISCQFEPDGTKKWKDEDRNEVTNESVHC